MVQKNMYAKIYIYKYLILTTVKYVQVWYATRGGFKPIEVYDRKFYVLKI